MDQFRQVGEVLGSLKALMVLKNDISINQKQCSLLFDMLVLAFETISEEIRQNLRFEERNTKWKALELPFKELHRIFKEADLYIRHCLDVKDWWGKAVSLHMNRDCVEFHIHNLLSCLSVVIEAIETASEISGVNQEDMQKRRISLMKKYDPECDDPKFFQWKYGKQYLVTRDICSRLDTVGKEDRWLFLEKLEEKKRTAVMNSAKHEQTLVELLLGKFNDKEKSKEKKVLPSNVLVGAQDYFVKRRLGSGERHFKEIHWLGESFALRTFYGEIEPLNPEISLALSLSHPNVLQYHCAFYDEERKEGFLVMELMNKDLGTYIKEHSGQRNRIPFPIPVAVDIMLQIARGMEYLHSKKIYHGDLNPSNILLKARNASTEGLFLAKVTGVGLTSIKSHGARSPKPNGIDLDIWLAPEVLAEQEQPGSKCTAKYTEKADVYSFGMLCFELLTGKIPFEDSHLKGETMVRNLKAGERPLFSYPSPKYLANFTRKCWQTNPSLRPTFSSICRVLRCIKRILVINPDHGDPDSPPPFVDYCDMEAGYLKMFPAQGNGDLAPVSQIPFQMFAYRLVEKEKISGKHWDLPGEGLTIHRSASVTGNEHLAAMDDLFLVPSDRRSVCSEIIDWKNSTVDVDLRSVISEIPHRKLFSLDQRSIGSESPGKRFSTTAADQRSFGAETPERKHSLVMDAHQSSPKIQDIENKVHQKSTSQKLNADVSEKNIAFKVVECLSATPVMAKNNKPVLTKGVEPKLGSVEMPEKKLLAKTVGDHKPAISESSEGKISSQVTAQHKLEEIPEKKVLKKTKPSKNLVSDSSITAEKVDSSDKIIQKLGHSKNLDKKPMFIRKLKDTKTKTVPETPNNDSQRSFSPARMNKANHGTSPASSPATATKTCASPKRSTAYASKEHSSPMSSPLNPCARCSRNSTPSFLPSTMSPRRGK